MKRNPHLIFALILLGLFLGPSGGCSRSQYRQKADQETYALVQTVANDPRWKLTDYTIQTSQQSRFYDPYNPDCEPMPTDDPTAHRLMKRVDGMKGSKAWDKYGTTRFVENPYWKRYLSVDNEGSIHLDKETAVRLALIHSPEYQHALENLYLSALTVSTQRFAFDTKFYGGNSIYYTADGKLRGGDTTLEDESSFGFTRRFATGADLAVGLANTLTWQFSGPDTFETKSVINFNFVQPLLRAGGRAVVLENLTKAERDFLAAVRQLAYYQQGFYVSTVTGTGRVSPPSGDSGSVVSGGGYYSLLSEQVQIQNRLQNIASLEDTVNRNTELFLANRIQDRMQIDQAKLTLLSSQESLLGQIGRYASSTETYLRSLGLPPDLKVKIRDPLLEQFQLMSPSLTTLQEDIKIVLALLRDDTREIPADLNQRLPDFTNRLRREVEVVEKDLIYLEGCVPNRVENLKLLERSPFRDEIEVGSEVRGAKNFEERVRTIQGDLPRRKELIETVCRLNEFLARYEREKLLEMVEEESLEETILWDLYTLRLLTLQPALQREILHVEKPFQDNQAGLAREKGRLQEDLQKIDEMLQKMQQSKLDRIFLEQALKKTEDDQKKIQTELLKILAQIQQIEAEKTAAARARIRDWVQGNRTSYDGKSVQEAKTVSSRAEVQLREEDYRLLRPQDTYRTWLLRIATRLSVEMSNLSIMQARTRLDSISLVPVNISSEEAFEIAGGNRLDWMNARAKLVDQWRQIEVTANALKSVLDLKVNGEMGTTGNNPVNFDPKNSTITAGLEWDSPLTRLIEQNAYRKALIDYQRAKRSYYTYVDEVQGNLRNSVRLIQISQLVFEIQRMTIFMAIDSVDLAQLRLEKPGRVGASDNATRDLLDALTRLLDGQNNFMSTWVNYLAQKMRLELDMGTMRLNSEGMWIDSGPIIGRLEQGNLPSLASPESEFGPIVPPGREEGRLLPAPPLPEMQSLETVP